VKERIIFYPEMIAFGGAERILLALSRHLHRCDIAHRLALYYLGTDLQSHADWPLPIRELRPPRNALLKARALKDYLGEQQRAEPGTALLVGIQAALHAGCLRSADYVLMILDTPSLLSNGGAQIRSVGARLRRAARSFASHQFLKRGVRRARAVITTSRYMAAEIQRLYGPQPAIARQGGLSSPLLPTSQVALRSSGARLLSVSRLEANKRIDWILQALVKPELRNQLEQHNASWHFDIVGEGAEKENLRRLAAQLGLTRSVTFHGHVTDTRLEELYAASSMFLMPAWQGYGLPALEALARRVPVVMHRDSGVSEILHGTQWVELIDGNVLGLVAGAVRMLGRLRAGRLLHEPLPSFPSEADWAEQVCEICDWS
jgi:glycosyltransferase involved in cell wall biosynthesis